MTLELRTQARRLAAEGYGWEDICHKLSIRCARGRNIVRETTLFHVKHMLDEHEEGRPMRVS